MITCHRAAMKIGILGSGKVGEVLANGFLFPNALLQHAIEDLEALSIDVGAIERRRDRMVPALRSMGYECSMPEGTFYLMAKAPTADDLSFSGALGDNDVKGGDH